MVFRSYIHKNNTIIRNSNVNTGKNPISEIYYGSIIPDSDETTYSRFLVQADFTRLKELVDDCYLGENPENLKHTLKLKNTISLDTDQEGRFADTVNKQRTNSFDLDLFLIEEEWDEGVGFDFSEEPKPLLGDFRNPSEVPSNWFNRNTLNLWEKEGAYDEDSVVIGTQHFDAGSEDLEIDITDYVNEVLFDDREDFGIGIKFKDEYEGIITEDILFVSFFSRHTNTYFEPFIETVIEEPVLDERDCAIEDNEITLCFYPNIKGRPISLDINPSVCIVNDCCEILGNFESECHGKGIYCARVVIPDLEELETDFLEDIWSPIIHNGRRLKDVTLSIPLLREEEYFDGSASYKNFNSDVSYAVSGIRNEEFIKRGDLRKIRVDVREPYTINDTITVDELQYRIFIKEGDSEIDVIDWTSMNKSSDFYYDFLDTSWMIPNVYYMDIKSNYNGEIKALHNVIKFRIVNQSLHKDIR